MTKADLGTSTVQAVLWDMDGTLVDTEPYWFVAEKEITSAHGVEWGEKEGKQLVGNPLPVSAQILRDAGVDLSVREIVDALTDSVVRQVREKMPWRPGARELLADLRAHGVPCVMVTMSERHLAEEIDALLPPGTFEFLVTGEMVRRGKPDPEAYLLAAELLSADHGPMSMDHIAAIEDSVPGLASAEASGAVAIGVPNQVPLAQGPGHVLWPTLAGRTLGDLRELVAQRNS